MKTTQLLRSLMIAASALTIATSAQAQTSPVEIGSANRGVNPYMYVGRVTDVHADGLTYIGTATVIRPQSVLTCAHNLWESGRGWTSNVKFEWGRYDSLVYKTLSASRRVILSGYSTAAANSAYGFSRDLGIINFASTVNGNFYAGRWANPALLTTAGYTKMSLGYAGGPYYTGNRIMKSGSTGKFNVSSGAWMTNPSYGIWKGMSGGPVFVWANSAWYVAAVNVSVPGNYTNTGAGVRALDTEGNNLINSYAY